MKSLRNDVLTCAKSTTLPNRDYMVPVLFVTCGCASYIDIVKLNSYSQVANVQSSEQDMRRYVTTHETTCVIHKRRTNQCMCYTSEQNQCNADLASHILIEETTCNKQTNQCNDAGEYGKKYVLKVYSSGWLFIYRATWTGNFKCWNDG
jgi:hypothetical protein